MNATTWVRVGLMVGGMAVAAGCDPVESDLTINADGSGRLVQKAHLSAAARVLLAQVAPPEAAGYRPILSEEAAKAWRDANAGGKVQLAAFTNRPQPDGSLRIECEVAFSDVGEFAESVWGWPFQLSSTGSPDGVRLQFDDPVRYMAQKAIGRADAARTVEAAAVMEMLNAFGKSVRIRTVVRLPGVARAVEGGVPAQDGREVACVSSLEQGAADWLKKKPASALLPPEAVQFKAFAADELAADRAAPWLRPIEGGKSEEGFYFRLGQVTSTRYVNYAAMAADPPRVDERININLQLFGPGDAALISTRGREPTGAAVPMLAAVRDGQGNDLRSADTTLSLYTSQGWPTARGVAGRERSLGTAYISLRAVTGSTRLLSNVEGYFVGLLVTEEGKQEVRPLRSNLNKEFDVGGRLIKFTAIRGNAVDYTVSQKDPKNTRMGDWPLDIHGYAGDGRELARPGVPSTEPARAVGVQSFVNAFPADGYLVVIYPAKVREVRLPFAFKEIRLP